MNDKIVKTLLLALLAVFQLSGCVYYPQLTDIPLINKKHDLRLDGNLTFAFSGNGTVSYGLTKDIAMQFYGNAGQGYYFQGAAGYYKDLGSSTIIEIYGGYGAGYGESEMIHSSTPKGKLTDHYRLYFTQFNIGSVEDNNIHLEEGFGLKLGYMNSRLNDRYYFYPYTENGNYAINNLLFEPQGFIRFGGKKLKVNLKGGLSLISHKYTVNDMDIPFGKFNVGIGLNYRF